MSQDSEFIGIFLKDKRVWGQYLHYILFLPNISNEVQKIQHKKAMGGL